MTIGDHITAITQLKSFRAGIPSATGTGFFYSHNSDMYLITNRHVIIDENDDYYPDEIVLKLHTDPDNRQVNTNVHVSLYNKGEPLWLEHPTEGEQIDVVALPFDYEATNSPYHIVPFSQNDHLPDDVAIGIGGDVLVVGYPLGFYDEVNNLPIVRNAIIASVYPVPFEGNPYMIIDSRLHSGTSGSPVVTKETSVVRFRSGRTRMSGGAISFLVGVHSATFDISTRDPDEDEPLGLAIVWFASLIPEIIEQ